MKTTIYNSILKSVRYKTILLSLIVSITFSILFFTLRVLHIIPSTQKETIIIFILILVLITNFLVIKKINDFYKMQFIFYTLYSLLFFFLTYVEKNIITIHWYYCLISIISFTLYQKLTLILNTFILILILILIYFLDIKLYLYDKLILTISFLSFYLISFIISYYLEKFSFETSLKNELLEKLSFFDYLTEAYNRRAFFKFANILINDAKRENKNLALLMMDIDYFKKINDTYGHEVGDIVLKEFVSLIKKNIRKNDLFARIGGEEFVLLIKINNEYQPYSIANKILKLIETSQIIYKNYKIKFTISIGGYIFNPNTDSLESALAKADKALYKAKERRNTIVIFNSN
ncbi:GGDEF domain-containing protein [Caminibacter mediatlanticus]|uniref:GGDEF domain-containing protein n=1 Tax=Caminibacter mediatlanticus TaxID=291048 RepID=UPI0002DA5315|nr:GGDEF domain-containing protein [Caminibacter mediatlanticus]